MESLFQCTFLKLRSGHRFTSKAVSLRCIRWYPKPSYMYVNKVLLRPLYQVRTVLISFNLRFIFGFRWCFAFLLFHIDQWSLNPFLYLFLYDLIFIQFSVNSKELIYFILLCWQFFPRFSLLFFFIFLSV